MKINQPVPNVTFKTRVRDESVGGENPYRWQDMTSDDYFKGRRVVIFSLPGAFTPTCSTRQVPGFESEYAAIKKLTVDEVYCISVNDAFVMSGWARSRGLQNLKMIPDGSGHFTRGMGMLVDKDNLGFGFRSWRYAMVVNDGVIEYFVEEPGRADNCESDPYGETSPEAILAYLTTTVS
jgi:peroxiredoxin